MSSAVEKSDAASGDQKFVDFDEFVDYQLRKTRTEIKQTDVLTGLVGVAVVVLGYLLAFVLLDQWVIAGGFSPRVRTLMLTALVLAVGAWMVRRLIWPYFHRVTELYAARELEQSDPGLKSTLLTLVDLRRAGRPVPSQLKTAMEKRAAVSLSQMDLERVVDRRALMRLSYVLLGLVAAMCAYAVLSPKSMSASIWRALLPAADVAVATRTVIEDVDPGDVSVLSRSMVEVTAELSGQIPEEVLLLYTTSDRRFVDEPIVMQESGEGLNRYRALLSGANGEGLLQNLTYHIEAGDARTSTYTVEVHQPPTAKVEEVAYDYPDYMQIDDKVEASPAIDAWEGTSISVRATTNMPVVSARLILSETDDLSLKGVEIPMKVTDGRELAATWRLEFWEGGAAPQFYHIQLQTEAGDEDPRPTLHPVRVRKDLPPQLTMLYPTSNIEAAADATIPLAYEARDPDFQLRSVTLRLQRGDVELEQAPRLYGGPPFTSAIRSTYDLELEEFDLQPGDRLTLWLEAYDNLVPFPGRSENRTVTPKLHIDIVEDVPPEQAAQQEQQRRREREERLEERDPQQQRGGETAEQPQDPQPGEEPREGTTSEEPGQEGAEGEMSETAEGQGRQPGESPQPSDMPDPGSEGSPGEQPQPESSSSEQPGERSQEGTGPMPSEQPQDGSPEERQPQEGAPQDRQPVEAPMPSPQPEQGSDSRSEQPQKPQRPEKALDDEALRKLMEKYEREPQPEGGTDPQQPEQPGEETQPRDEQPRPGEQPMPESQPGERPAGEEPTPGDEMPGEQPMPGDEPMAGEQPMPEGERPQESQGPGEKPESGQQAPAPGEEPSDPMSEKPAGPEGGTSEPMPSPDGDMPGEAESTKPGSEPSKPGEEPSGQPKPGEQPMPGAQEEPAPDSPDAQQRPDDGTGKGMAKPEDDPNAKPTPAEQRQDRQPGEEPMRKPGTGEGPMDDVPQDPQQKPGTPGSKQKPGMQPESGQERQAPSPQETKPGEQPPGEPPQPSDATAPQKGSDQPSGDQPSGDQPGQQGDPSGKGEPSDSGKPGDPSAQQGSPEGSKPGDGGEPGEGGKPGDAQKGEGGAGGEKSSGEKPEGDMPEGGEPKQEGDMPEQTGQPPEGEKGAGEKGGEQGSGEKGGGEKGGGEKGGGEKGAGEGGADGGGAGEKPGEGGMKPGQGSASGAGKTAGGGGFEGGTDTGDGTGSGSGTDAAAQGTPADLEAKKKAANLVLDRLSEDLKRGQVDQEMLDDLGWNENDLRSFMQRLEDRLSQTGDDPSPEARFRQQQFESLLKGLDYKPESMERSGGTGPRRSAQGFAPARRPAPPEYRGDQEAYKRRLLRMRQIQPENGE